MILSALVFFFLNPAAVESYLQYVSIGFQVPSFYVFFSEVVSLKED